MELNPADALVSIIIPTYNRPAYLKEAIASVLCQTYQNFEIIVSDDCSVDNPQPVIDAFQDARIRLRRNPTNLGIALNVTAAFQEATGKYVASLNDDDLWYPNFLEQLIAPLEANPELVIAFCDHDIVDANGAIDPAMTAMHTKLWHRDRLEPGVHQNFWKIGLIDQSISPASSAVLRREKVEWHRLSEGGVFWDYYIIYLAGCSDLGAYYCVDRLSSYRIHAQSETVMSGNKNPQAKIRKGKAEISCYSRFLQDQRLQEFKPYFEQRWAHANTTLGIGLLRANQFTEARSHLLQALQSQKFNFRTIVSLILSYIPGSLANRLLYIRNPGV